MTSGRSFQFSDHENLRMQLAEEKVPWGTRRSVGSKLQYPRCSPRRKQRVMDKGTNAQQESRAPKRDVEG
jgi:hypothetical protein